MRLSTERILTTHVGSMPRPQAVVDMLMARENQTGYDPAAFDAVMGEIGRASCRERVCR